MRPIRWPGVALAAAIVAAVAAGGGALLEPLWFGATRDAGFDRVEEHVRRRFDDLTRTLQRTAVSLAGDPGLPAGLTGDRADLVRLFELTRDSVPAAAGDLAVTVYDATATPRAWRGRPAELSRDHVLSESGFHVVSGPLGLRLVYVEPIAATGAGSGRRARVGSVSAESVLSAGAEPAAGDRPSPLASPVAPLGLRAAADPPVVEPGRHYFTLTDPSGEPLLEASVANDDLGRARADWQRSVRDLGFVLAALLLVWERSRS